MLNTFLEKGKKKVIKKLFKCYHPVAFNSDVDDDVTILDTSDPPKLMESI